MTHICTRASIAALLVATTVTTAAFGGPVTMDWTTVGNAGNAPEFFVGTPFGAVNRVYRIGKYEVTNSQYAAFLNAVAASDPNGLYDTSMGNNVRGGIVRSGSNGSFTYSVKANMGDKPVNFVSWFDAARMSNWMTNGQGAGGTESGVYTLTGPTSISGINRDANDPSQVFLPNKNEWHKAAYHQPASQGGDSDDYWLYPTASNSAPTIATATSTGDIANPGANVANYDFGADWNSQNGNVTTVGSAGPDSASFYGTFDQGGNVWEWTQQRQASLGQRILRGGGWDGSEANMRSANGGSFDPAMGLANLGFRLASHVPEPGAVAILVVGAPLLARRRRP